MGSMWELESHFLLAIKGNKVDHVRYLVSECGLDVDHLFGSNAQSAIHLATETGQCDMLNCLIELGASVNHSDNDGLTPLHIAVRSQRIGIIQKLLCQRAGVNAATFTGYQTPLHIAVGTRNLEVVRQLVEAGAKVNLVDRQGCSSLLMASCFGADDIVTYLLGRGSDMRMADLNGNTIFHFLNKLNHLTVEMIIEKGRLSGFLNAFANKANKTGITPLHALCSSDIIRRPASISVVQYLLSVTSIDVNAPDPQGRTPIFLAAQTSPQLTGVLVRAGAHVCVKDNLGHTPLRQVARLRDRNLIQEVIALGALLYGEDLKWILNPGESDINAGTLEYLQEIASSLPYTLQFYCRLSLLKRFRSRLHVALDQVSLPRELKDFVLMKHNRFSLSK